MTRLGVTLLLSLFLYKIRIFAFSFSVMKHSIKNMWTYFINIAHDWIFYDFYLFSYAILGHCGFNFWAKVTKVGSESVKQATI